MQGGMEVYEVPGCNHMDIIKEDYGALWAERLRVCLMQAHEQARVQYSETRTPVSPFRRTATNSTRVQ